MNRFTSTLILLMIIGSIIFVIWYIWKNGNSSLPFWSRSSSLEEARLLGELKIEREKIRLEKLRKELEEEKLKAGIRKARMEGRSKPKNPPKLFNIGLFGKGKLGGDIFGFNKGKRNKTKLF